MSDDIESALGILTSPVDGRTPPIAQIAASAQAAASARRRKRRILASACGAIVISGASGTAVTLNRSGDAPTAISAVEPTSTSASKTVPDLFGLTLQQARNEAEGVGMKVDIELPTQAGQPNLPDVENGTVVAQDPVPDALVEPGANVIVRLTPIPFALRIVENVEREVHLDEPALNYLEVDIAAGFDDRICAYLPLRMVDDRGSLVSVYDGPCGHGETWTIE